MIDSIDRQIIVMTQAGLPLVSEPYLKIADELGISQQELISRIKNMQALGIIRRIAAVPNHYRLGYRYNGMTVWNIDDEFVDKLGKQIGELNFVSHCYHRPRHLPEWPYNLFAMVHSQSQQGLQAQVDQISQLLGDYNRGQDVLLSTRILKKTGLRISG